ncbi:hypothetical protein WSM22_35760 [Cytophagales bacterium WSM2-2]|nr:hypothetical protein WSM22_35760 [Cytophagales bacterium WSM2-2]
MKRSFSCTIVLFTIALLASNCKQDAAATSPTDRAIAEIKKMLQNPVAQKSSSLKEQAATIVLKCGVKEITPELNSLLRTVADTDYENKLKSRSKVRTETIDTPCDARVVSCRIMTISTGYLFIYDLENGASEVHEYDNDLNFVRKYCDSGFE